MDTNFPEGESATLKLTLKAPKQFTLALRRPSWAGAGFTVKVNGQTVKGKQKVTVRFQATGGNETAAVFGIRIIRADQPR